MIGFRIDGLIRIRKPGCHIAIQVVHVIVQFIFAPYSRSFHKPKSFVAVITKLDCMEKLMDGSHLDIFHFRIFAECSCTI